ncbi:MAG: 50S ribosomal protein L23 [Gammaproteobacteria bacterium]
MNQERLMQVLVEPRQSEKSTRVADKHRQYLFRVLTDATKPEIKAAVELLFKVKVEGVTTSMVPSRLRNFRGRAGTRNAWKKAYVTLAEGFEIDFVGGGD